MKVWVRNSKLNNQHSINTYNARLGFESCGFEVIEYEGVSDIKNSVSKKDIVLDGICQVNFILNMWGIAPDLFNYPKELTEFLGRNVWRDTINSIASDDKKWSAGYFVKPVKEKVFTGRVVKSLSDLIGCGSCYENYEVECSDAVNIKREWRVFIRYDEVLDVRPYSGDWHYNYDSSTLDSMLDAFKTWNDRPFACSMDIAVIETFDKKNYYMPEEKTILVEMNDAYALGCYGLNSIDYAKLISARWSQLLNRPDELKF